MKYSAETNLIAKALIAVQKKIEPVVKDSTNPHFKNNYASLDSLTEYVRPILAEEGLALLQGAEAYDMVPGASTLFVDVATTLMHESGQYVESVIRMPLDKANPQGAGSAMTYGRRYGLAALLAISTEEDDDAEAAVRRNVGRMPTVAERTGHSKPPAKLPNETDAEAHEYGQQSVLVACPKCGSDMWDNRATKKNPKAPDYKCKDKSCDGVIWPPRGKKPSQQDAFSQEAPPYSDDEAPY